jgi:hypothetical protein
VDFVGGYELRLEAEGSALRAYVDGVHVFTVTDSVHSEGTYGLISAPGGGWVDWLRFNEGQACIAFTATPTITETFTATGTVTVSGTATPTATVTATPTVTETVTPTATDTPTLTATETVTPTPEGGGGGMARLGVKEAAITWLRPDQRLLAVPNPARSDLWLAWRQDRPGNARITAFDLAGSQVRQWSFEGRNAGEHRDRVGVDGLASGIYIIVLEGQSLDGPAVLARGKLAVVR